MAKRRRWVGAIILLAAFVAACTDDSDDTAGDAATLEPSTTATSASDSSRSESGTSHACVPVTECTLRQIGDNAGVLIGTAVNPALIDEIDSYSETLAREFSSVTPENDLKWQHIHPEREVWDFESVDRLVEFAAENDMAIRGHNLLWHQASLHSTPEWVLEVTDPAELEQVIRDHIGTVMDRYEDSIERWDVVNEPLETLGETLFQSHFYNVLGPGYLDLIFEIAHEADPEAILYVNEPTTEISPAKRAALIELVRGMVERGVPIHGVGLQGHLLLGAPEVGVFADQIRVFRDLGLEVAITELDVPAANGDLDAQAEIYRQVAQECVDAGCSEITVWGVGDAHTWLDDFLGIPSYPLLFDAEYQPKPAYEAMREALGVCPVSCS